MGKKRSVIFTLANKGEASARKKLKSLRNPPDDEITSALKPAARDCYAVLGFVRELRIAIRFDKTEDAGLAGFRLGQALLNAAMRPLARDAQEGLRWADARRAGAATSKRARAVSNETILKLRADLRNLRTRNPRISFTRVSELLSPKYQLSPRTIRKHLSPNFET